MTIQIKLDFRSKDFALVYQILSFFFNIYFIVLLRFNKHKNSKFALHDYMRRKGSRGICVTCYYLNIQETKYEFILRNEHFQCKYWITVTYLSPVSRLTTLASTTLTLWAQWDSRCHLHWIYRSVFTTALAFTVTLMVSKHWPNCCRWTV